MVRFVGTGALAGVFATVSFTVVHYLIISPIWFALPAMVPAGAVCGACLAWSYRLVTHTASLATWIRFNLLYVLMFATLGVVSIIVFDPVTTIGALLATKEPPRELIGRALPMTVLFTVMTAIVLSVLYRPSWPGMAALLITTAVLVTLLGLNISTLGLVSVPSGDAGVLAEVFGLVGSLAAIYVIGVRILARDHFVRPRRP